jgi:molybdopterin-binding protein
VRVELVTGDGVSVHAQLTRQACEELELREGQIVYIRPNRPLRAVA